MSKLYVNEIYPQSGDWVAVSGNLDVSGTLTAYEFNTIVQSETTYLGSNSFGNDSTDVHAFTGSLEVTGSGVTFTGAEAGAVTLTLKADQGDDSESVVLTAADGGAFTIDSTTATVTVDGHTGVTITSSNSGEVDITSAAAVDINATTGVTVDGTTLSIDGTDDSNLTVTASGKDLDIAVAGGGTQELRLASAGTGAAAIHLNASAGGIDIDSADMLDIDAADEITIDTTSADGHIAITSAHTAGQSILISANANAGSILDVDAGIIDIDVQDTINIDAADEIEIATTSADGHIKLASAHTAGLAFHIDANADADSEVQIDAGVLDIDVTGASTLDTTSLTVTSDDVVFASANSTDPLVVIKNTNSDANGARLRFTKDKGAAGADGDDIGVIEFVGDDAGQTQTTFAKIVAEVSEADNTDEAGKLSLFVAESDGTTTTLTAGLILEGEHATDGEVDVTIGAGTSSTTTIVGTSQFNGNATFGVDDTGVDVRFYSATASEGVLYDASEDELALLLTTKLKFHDVGGGEEIFASSNGHLEINAGTTLDMTAPTVDINASTEVTIDSDTVTFGSAEANDPLVIIKNTASDATGARLRFVKDKGAAGAADDVAGLIEFYADDASQDQVLFAKIEAAVKVHTNGQEGGLLDLGVATHDGEMQVGISLEDGDAEDEIDVTIGSGTSSVTTIAGTLDLGDRNITNVGDIDLDSISVADAASGLNIDMSGANTGTGLITLGDNLQKALEIKEGSNTYMYINTQNSGGEFIMMNKMLEIESQDASASDTGAELRLTCNDEAAMGSGHRLGVIEFAGAEDGSHSITVGARIEALTDAGWSGTENGASLYFYTTDADASQSEVLKLDSDKLATFSGAAQFNGNATFGVDDTGVDVRFYSATASEGVLYDASEDELALLLTTKLKFHDVGGGEEIFASSNGHLEINAGTTLDITAPTVDINASTAVQIDGPELIVSSSTSERPVLTLENNGNNTDGAELKFKLDKGAAGADNDLLGIISFYGDDDAQDNIEFACIEASVSDASNGQEGGKLQFKVATHDGERQPGLVLQDGSAEDEVDVTIGNGTASVTTIAGTLDLGDRNITNVGDIDLDSISVADAASGLNIDMSGANTGTGLITLGDNLQKALEIKEGSNTYMYINTQDSHGEFIMFNKMVEIESQEASASDTGAELRLTCNDEAAMGSGHRLGVLEFAGAEDGSHTITVGAKIEAVCDAGWSATENGADLIFYTTDGNASQSEVMRLMADNEITMKFADANTAGSGVGDAVMQEMYVSKVNGEIVTTILIDVEGLQNGGAIKHVICDSGENTAGYLTQLTAAVNGYVYKCEMACIEPPGNGASGGDKISLYFSDDATLGDGELADAGSNEVRVIDGTSNAWSDGMMLTNEGDVDLSNGGNAIYVYLAAGAGSSDAPMASGKFVIKFYGANF